MYVGGGLSSLAEVCAPFVTRTRVYSVAAVRFGSVFAPYGLKPEPPTVREIGERVKLKPNHSKTEPFEWFGLVWFKAWFKPFDASRISYFWARAR